MASLLKNQLIKRLSKFVKNLSANQINLSTFKGEGELSSINLDEKVLEDVIELPVWLTIQRATCGRAFIKIPWTNLKTLPIQIQLDDVTIEIETCEKLRDAHTAPSGADPMAGKYGYINRVIDGISLTITNLTFEIKAQGFKASICVPSLDIYSVSPNGKRVETLTSTRLRSPAKDSILLFKEISWANARIQASSNDSSLPGTALRFIANSCRIRIAMKKNLQDSSLITSRVMINFDDFLSVVNDAQLNSALNTYKEIMELMKRASEEKKRNVGEKLNKSERPAQAPTFPPKASANSNHELANPYHSMTAEQQLTDAFTRFDIIETSIHFNIKRLDLHIIAESGALADRFVENGALQVTIANLSLDHYPYHEFGSSKKHWVKYNEIQAFNRNEWADKLHEHWQEQFNIAKASVPNDETSKRFEKALRTNRIRLFESCSVINIDDLVFYPVSLTNDKHQKRRRPLIASDRTYYQMPDSFGLINIQHTEYYYPLPYSFPVPNSDLYMQIMPFLFRVDFATATWLHAFLATLSITIDSSGVLKTEGPSADLEHMEIKVEAMLPRIIISSDVFSSNQQAKGNVDTPNPPEYETLELTISRLAITNARIESASSEAKLQEHLALFKGTTFFQQSQWPLSSTTTPRISPLFEKHPYETYLHDNPLRLKTGRLPEPRSASKTLQTYYTMTTDSLKKSGKCDIWHFAVENIYLDFTPLPSSDSVRPVKQNMISSLTLNGWTALDTNDKDACLSILGVLETPPILKISQKQYTFIMRLVDELGVFGDIIERNTTQATLIKQKLSIATSTDEMKITICLTAPTTFTLAVIDTPESTTLDLPMSSTSSLREVEIESVTRDEPSVNMLNDVVNATPVVPPVPLPTRVESPILAKNRPVAVQKKSRFEENLQRGFDFFSKSSRGSSVASSLNMSDSNDDTLSQLDITEDLDADLDATLFANDFEQQKAARIELDDDCISLTEKKSMRTTALELVNGVFIKVNLINVCITEDSSKSEKPMYIACNAKYLRIDEFAALKIDSIKPKLFENDSPDEYNNENVPPIDIRIDLSKGDSSTPSLPTISLHIRDRTLTVASRAIDIITQNLEEVLTFEQKLARQNEPIKMAPIDITLKNVQFTMQYPQEYLTPQVAVDVKPPIKVDIEHVRVLRQIDGQLKIQKTYQQDEPNQLSPSATSGVHSVDDLHGKLRELESFRLENERLRSELDAQKTEIQVLRRERDCLVQTVSKLDTELTEAEYKRISQVQPKK